jgi:hypothetical protein
MITRRHTLMSGVLALLAAPALAHHGWRWTDGGQFELTGIVRAADLGNPHGVLTIDADGEMWTAEVGQPWRNERAGLDAEMMAPGRELTILGERAADPADLRMKAEVVVVDGVRHVLYPDRV